MSYKLLMEIVRYDENKHNYTKAECIEIERGLKERAFRSTTKPGDSIVKLFDKINDQ